MAEAPGGIRYASAEGRWVLLATVLAFGMASIDATVVNVALPAISRDLHAGFAVLQWTVNAYALALSSLLLLGGALGDRFGRRRVFLIGVCWFTASSVLCGLAPAGWALISARALQGVGAALLSPGTLAIIETTFAPEDRAAAIGAWSGLGGVATAAGPLLGGYLVQAVSWRLAFLINVPVAIAVLVATLRHVPDQPPSRAGAHLDVTGAALAAVGLGLAVYGLTEGPPAGWPPADVAALAGGAVALAAFTAVEVRSPQPMLPLGIFRIRQFTATNVVTFLVYGALGGLLFLLPIELQRAVGWTPLEAGSSLLPLTAVMLVLSARVGRLSHRIGPRLLMAVGPVLAGAGLLLLLAVRPGMSYLTGLLPGVLVWGVGMSLTVAPLTATVMASAGDENAGLASAVNNDVARTAGLLAVAVLPMAAGIGQAAYAHPAVFSAGFHRAVVIAAALCMAGGLLSAAFIRNPARPVGAAPEAADERDGHLQCPVSGPSVRGPAERPARAPAD